MGFSPAGVGQNFGYARVSTTDQSLEVQVEALEADGVHAALIFKERVSGNSREGRPELRRLLAIMRPGDILTVTRVDRLARSHVDLINILTELQRLKCHIRCIEQPVDTTSIEGRAFFGMLAVFAEFETNIRRERQAEGIAKAKAEGRYNGRPATIDKEAIRRMKREGLSNSEIARRMKCNRASVIRALRERHSGPFVRPRDGETERAELRDALTGINDVMRETA